MPLSKFTQAELEEFKKEFKSLTSVKEKYKFWQNRLNFPYYLTYKLSHSEISDFYFEGKFPDEIEILNELILEEVRLKRTLEIIDSEKLESNLLLKLADVIKPVPILEEELKKIRDIIEKQEIAHKKTNVHNVEEYTKAKFFLNGYQEFYFKGKEINLTEQNYSTPYLISQLNGNEIAKYQIFIENKIKNPSSKKMTEHSETSLKQQILILHYLGILENLETSTNKNKIHLISKLLNRSESKVKTFLTYLGHNSEHNAITPDNLEYVINLFEKTGYKIPAKNAKTSLGKENKK